MVPTKRMVVGLSLRELEDRSTLHFVAKLAPAIGVDTIHFLHVVESLDLPPTLLKDYPTLVEPVDEAVRKTMHDVVSKYCRVKASKEVEVDAGSTLRLLLQRTKQKNADLIVVGRKNNHRAVLPDMIARKAPCSVAVVPEGIEPSLRRILVPLDFSEHASSALVQAAEIAQALGLSEVSCVHVYEVPLGYYKAGKSYEEFASIMKGHAEKHCASMMEKIDLKGIEPVVRYVPNRKPAQAILDEIRQQGADLVVMGARGRTRGGAFLLGSVTEKVVRTVPVPLLAVKAKGVGLNLLNALLEI